MRGAAAAGVASLADDDFSVQNTSCAHALCLLPIRTIYTLTRRSLDDACDGASDAPATAAALYVWSCAGRIGQDEISKRDQNPMCASQSLMRLLWRPLTSRRPWNMVTGEAHTASTARPSASTSPAYLRRIVTFLVPPTR